MGFFANYPVPNNSPPINCLSRSITSLRLFYNSNSGSPSWLRTFNSLLQPFPFVHTIQPSSATGPSLQCYASLKCKPPPTNRIIQEVSHLWFTSTNWLQKVGSFFCWCFPISTVVNPVAVQLELPKTLYHSNTLSGILHLGPFLTLTKNKKVYAFSLYFVYSSEIHWKYTKVYSNLLKLTYCIYLKSSLYIGLY